jgi:hypothetical protein
MVHKIGSYLPMTIIVLTLIATWRFGDWRNWKKYYSSILFTICINFAVSILTYTHSLWHFEKVLFIPNHTIADFMLKFTNFPAIVLTYLSRYPFKTRLYRQLVYIAFWVVIFSLLEGLSVLLKIETYHNGWNYWWSVVVWLSLFVGVTLHHTKPPLAWLLFFIGTSFLIVYFHIPISKMK